MSHETVYKNRGSEKFGFVDFYVNTIASFKFKVMQYGVNFLHGIIM